MITRLEKVRYNFFIVIVYYDPEKTFEGLRFGSKRVRERERESQRRETENLNTFVM